MEAFDVVIVGAGAAGLMCAMTAGRRGRRVLLLEHGEQVGAKILISGGGRCNFTNLHASPDQFFSGNPHFPRSALSRYTQHDFIALVERHAIAYHEKTLGQLFCDGSARAIVAMLLAECEAAGVVVRLQHRVTDVAKSDRFRVVTDHAEISAESFVLATGGLSIPKMGATGFAYDVARRFGLAMTETRPALVPLVFGSPELEHMAALSGVSLPVAVRCGRTEFRESLLFTHRGLSGPAILQISSCWREGRSLVIDMLPDLDAATYLRGRKLARPNAELKTILAEALPQRLALSLLPGALATQRAGEIRDRELDALAAQLSRWSITPTGSEGYGKAEVTLGGVDTRGLSSKTMHANAVPGLYVIGEAVDVTGWLGGYNFQWAWSSGWCAGEAA